MGIKHIATFYRTYHRFSPANWIGQMKRIAHTLQINVSTGLCFLAEPWMQLSFFGLLPSFSAVLLICACKRPCTSTDTNNRENLEKKKEAGLFLLSFFFLIANFLDSFHLVSLIYPTMHTHITDMNFSVTILYKNTTLLYVSISNCIYCLG